jgi:hypothetical protein
LGWQQLVKTSLEQFGAQAKEGIVNYFGAAMTPTPPHNGLFSVGSNRIIAFCRTQMNAARRRHWMPISVEKVCCFCETT